MVDFDASGPSTIPDQVRDGPPPRSGGDLMRIIAGRFRGRPLQTPAGQATRPTADRVREAPQRVDGGRGVSEGHEYLGVLPPHRRAVAVIGQRHEDVARLVAGSSGGEMVILHRQPSGPQQVQPGSIGGRTPLGPFLFSLGFVDGGSWQLQFTIGRPIEEGSLFDQVQ